MAIGGIVWAICFCMGRYVSHATLVICFLLDCSYMTAAHGRTSGRLIAHFPVDLQCKPLYQSEARCTTILMKMS